MKNETLKQIIIQIKKYGLVDVFKTIDNFKNWISTLDSKQINSFLSLNIEPKEVENFKSILINRNLLSCQDYSKRVEAIAKLKNGDECWYLFDKICNPKFLESKNFYEDIAMISKADDAKYGLLMLEEDLFINSPYHNEDLRLILEAKDSYTAEALAEVAKNINSINSPYHQKDMILISRADNDFFEYSEIGLQDLAINEDSLKDKYHLENKNYRKEVEILKNAKSKINARVLYYYIANPTRKFFGDNDYFNSLLKEDLVLCNMLRKSPMIFDRSLVAGSNDPEYLNNLIKMNNMDEKLVMHYAALLMNPHFLKSQYKEFDLKVLESITDFNIFMDLYTLISKRLNMIDNQHHQDDVVLLSKTIDSETRKWLVRRMTREYDNNNNYNYDIEYITRLKLDSISNETKEEMKYYLFDEKEVNEPKHIEKLESLLNGVLVERQDSLLNYLNKLEEELDTKEVEELVPNKKAKSRVLNLSERDRKY